MQTPNGSCDSPCDLFRDINEKNTRDETRQDTRQIFAKIFFRATGAIIEFGDRIGVFRPVVARVVQTREMTVDFANAIFLFLIP